MLREASSQDAGFGLRILSSLPGANTATLCNSDLSFEDKTVLLDWMGNVSDVENLTRTGPRIKAQLSARPIHSCQAQRDYPSLNPFRASNPSPSLPSFLYPLSKQ